MLLARFFFSIFRFMLILMASNILLRHRQIVITGKLVGQFLERVNQDFMMLGMCKGII